MTIQNELNFGDELSTQSEFTFGDDADGNFDYDAPEMWSDGSTKMLDCPQGHNAIDSRFKWTECGACGAFMSHSDESDFMDSLVRADQLM